MWHYSFWIRKGQKIIHGDWLKPCGNADWEFAIGKVWFIFSEKSSNSVLGKNIIKES